ncbi:MAG: DNA primase catalytic subunit PriS [Hadesarchaea archaeon]|nr:MAG: DNA primase catalytic subunit PriS [Hadesarchaea archaeon]HDI12633.1 DNA primase catalytic subunit PriS [Hadesarchaea archaeon]
MMMREATPEERRIFYKEEWNKREIPDFILHSLSLREFGFDLDGTGPSHRYNQFITVEQLENFMRNRAPYSAFASVALYERPSAREGWLKSELVLDIDAKDLPIRSCSCPPGKVCERCIDDARKVAMEFAETLSGDLDLHNIHFVYSGRGFHVRVTDESVMGLEQNERGQIVEYVTGGVVPTDITMALGYSKVFRERAARTFNALNEERLLGIRGLRKTVIQRLMCEKERALKAIRDGKLDEIFSFEGMSQKTFCSLLGFLARINSGFADGKVTIDTKRILRLPSSLHSGVSMKCTLVRDIEHFKLESAVPKFVRERNDEK